MVWGRTFLCRLQLGLGPTHPHLVFRLKKEYNYMSPLLLVLHDSLYGEIYLLLLISNFCPVLNVVVFFFWPIQRRLKFRNTSSAPPTKMELTECSEMSAHKFQMLGNHPKERIHLAFYCSIFENISSKQRENNKHRVKPMLWL